MVSVIGSPQGISSGDSGSDLLLMTSSAPDLIYGESYRCEDGAWIVVIRGDLQKIHV